MTADNDMQAVIDTAVAGTEPHAITDSLYSVVVPSGSHVLVDLEKYQAVPKRKRGTATLFTAGSLAEYVKTHRTDAASIYADVAGSTIVAVLNGDDASSPGWGDHRAVLTLRHPPAWNRWTGRNDKMGGQQTFAEHVETCLPDIVGPPAADLLEMAQSFQANVKVAFKSAKLLTNGQRQLVYEETIDAKAGQKGQLTIPELFVVALQPYEGSNHYSVTARLRYRIADGDLVIGYHLERPEDVLRSAFDDVLAEVAETTAITPLLGKPLTR